VTQQSGAKDQFYSNVNNMFFAPDYSATVLMAVMSTNPNELIYISMGYTLKYVPTET